MDVFGRAHEIGTIATWIGDAAPGPRVGVLVGDMGAGKSTIWSAALAAAGSRRVLACRSDPRETDLAYAGLGDLVRGVEDSPAVRDLPAPLFRALATALWWEYPGSVPPDRRAVALAVLEMVRRLAADDTVLIALDDLQSLDPATEVVLSFVLRRLVHEPVKVLATVGGGPHGADHWPALTQVVPADRVTRWETPPLSLDALATLVERRHGTVLTRPVLRRLHEACGGNPLFGLEMARLWAGPPGPGGDPPLPDSLRHLLRARISALSAEATEAALVVACAVRPTVAIIEQVTGEVTGLAEAVARQVIVLDGETPSFRNPLLRAAVLDAAGPLRRRETHLRLARSVSDVEERARHLAVTTSGPDAAVAVTLDAAALIAAGRGAALAAGEMAAHAARLTPADQREIGQRRRFTAARHLIAGGDGATARTVLEEALAHCSPGPGRAKAYFLLGQAIFCAGDVPGSITPLRQGRAEAAGQVELVIPITAVLAYFCMHHGDLPAAVAQARELLSLARGAGDAATAEAATAILAVLEFMGGGPAPDLALPVHRRGPDPQAPFLVALRMHGYLSRSRGDLPAARAAFGALREALADTGAADSAGWETAWAAEVECLAGDLRAAARHADLAARAGQASGRPSGAALLAEAHLLARRGELDRARRLARDGLAAAQAAGHRTAAIGVLALLGFIELSDGDLMAALRRLDAAGRLAGSLGVVLDTVHPAAGADHVEALVKLGRHDQAAERADRLHRAAQAAGRPAVRGLAGRARGLLLTATGSPKRGSGELRAAAGEFSAAGMAFELGRTLLALGEAETRLRRREAARRTAARAGAIFTEIGADGWAARVSLRAPLATPGFLTRSEARVALLAAEGRTNQEIAGELAVGVKTVESHLSSAYRKLGVRSRTELAVRMAAGPDAERPSFPARPEHV
ncbi:transcriptional regulator [Sphaerisporangium rufum]|uniref:Transcriptional regulator n=1 Tax=Sphaerisporangium rufum TaxID=1381558 RepID=A0A919UY99_9ACTN|nr:LuxR family transcriptional regulator [Sphaerisporangium rufum]GII77831.1 transcriptional regulator [Sphaerisporangium rufum]